MLFGSTNQRHTRSTSSACGTQAGSTCEAPRNTSTRAGACVIRFSVAAPPPPPCMGDADGSGTVDFADITSVLSNWGASYAPGAVPAPGDSDHGGSVNFADITATLANYEGPCA